MGTTRFDLVRRRARIDLINNIFAYVAIMVVCNVCGENFSTLFNLERHKKRVHSVRNERMDEDDNNVDNVEDNYVDMTSEEEDDIEDTESNTESTNDSSDEDSSDEDSSDEDDEVNIWASIHKCADGLEGDELKEQLMNSMKLYISLCRSLKKDNTARIILKTLKQAQDDDEMKYSEALEHAIDKRKFLLFKRYKKWKANQPEENE